VTLVGSAAAAAAEVAENSAVGTTVLQLCVTDADSDRAGQIDACQLTDNQHSDTPPPFTLRRRPSSSAHGCQPALCWLFLANANVKRSVLKNRINHNITSRTLFRKRHTARGL